MRRVLILTFGAWAWAVVGGMVARADVVIEARAFDGEASTKPLKDAFLENRQPDEGIKVPLASADLSVDLLRLEPAAPAPAGGSAGAGRSWQVKMDSTGSWKLDTGLESVPPGHAFVARAVVGGRKVFSPFFQPGADAAAPLAIHLYPTTESPANVRGEMRVAFDTMKEGEEFLLRVRIGVRLVNLGGEMYVGRRGPSPWREIWRVPLPPAARLLVNRGPQPVEQGWRVSRDGRWLVLDSPLPGLPDMTRQGMWEVHYAIPARQEFVQTFPVAALIEPQQATAWGEAGGVTLTSAQLTGPETGMFRDPFEGEQRRLQLCLNTERFRIGDTLTVGVSIDNAAIGQVSVNAVIWTGTFLLVLVAAMLAGLLLGTGRAPAEDIWEKLEGLHMADRIADLDARLARGEVSKAAYERYRECLMTLASEEGQEAQPAGRRGDSL